MQLLNVGRLAYRPSLALQKNLVDKVKQTNENFLVLVEHDPVYTTGIRNKGYDAIEEKRLKDLGADFVRTNRGGLITFHGHGQLVAYPILDLRQFFLPSGAKETSCNVSKKAKVLGMRCYVDQLEETVIKTLKVGFGIEGHRSPDTGVWVGRDDHESKICAMGVHNSDLVTCHGLAMNCNVDLRWFGHIVPCGIIGKGVTSITEQLGREVTIQDAEEPLLYQFQDCFGCDVVEPSHEIKDIVDSAVSEKS